MKSFRGLFVASLAFLILNGCTHGSNSSSDPKPVTPSTQATNPVPAGTQLSLGSYDAAINYLNKPADDNVISQAPADTIASVLTRYVFQADVPAKIKLTSVRMNNDGCGSTPAEFSADWYDTDGGTHFPLDENSGFVVQVGKSYAIDVTVKNPGRCHALNIAFTLDAMQVEQNTLASPSIAKRIVCKTTDMDGFSSIVMFIHDQTRAGSLTAMIQRDGSNGTSFIYDIDAICGTSSDPTTSSCSTSTKYDGQVLNDDVNCNQKRQDGSLFAVSDGSLQLNTVTGLGHFSCRYMMHKKFDMALTSCQQQ